MEKLNRALYAFSLFLALFMLTATPAKAQSGYYRDISYQWNGVNLIPNANARVTICASTAPVIPVPCTNKVTIYSNQSLTIEATNPLTAGADGGYSFWIAPGLYAYTVTGTGLIPQGPFLFTVVDATTGGGTGIVPVTVAGADYVATSTGVNTAAWEQVNSGSSCGDSSHAVSYSTVTHKFGCQSITAGGVPGGANCNVQFNNSGSFGGDAQFCWDSTNRSLVAGPAKAAFAAPVQAFLDNASEGLYSFRQITGASPYRDYGLVVTQQLNSTGGLGAFSSGTYLENASIFNTGITSAINYLQIDGTGGTSGAVAGQFGLVVVSSNSTNGPTEVSSIAGVTGGMEVFGGTTTFGQGVTGQVGIGTGGILTNGYALDAWSPTLLSSPGSEVITNSVGLHVMDMRPAGVPVTNGYGILLDAQSGHAIWSLGGDSYHSGPVVFGPVKASFSANVQPFIDTVFDGAYSLRRIEGTGTTRNYDVSAILQINSDPAGGASSLSASTYLENSAVIANGISGAFNGVQIDGAGGTSGSVQGNFGFVSVTGNSTNGPFEINALMGVQGGVEILGGTTTWANGLNGQVGIGNANGSNGNIINGYAVEALGPVLFAPGAGAITNAVGLHVQDQKPGAYVTNGYGILLDAQNGYSIYSAGGQSFHSGNFIFGSDILPNAVSTSHIGSTTKPFLNVYFGPASGETIKLAGTNLTANRTWEAADAGGTITPVTGSPTDGDCAKITVAGGLITGIASAGVGNCSGSGGTTAALSALTAATGSNSITNGDNDQSWQWHQTTNSTTAMEFTESSAGTATTAFLMNIHTLAASTVSPFQVTSRGLVNGITVSATTGTLSALGTANINATQYKGGTASGVGSACGANNFVTALNDAAGPTCNQPAFSNLSGTIALAQTALTTAGDLLFADATPLLARLAIGTSGQCLLVSGGRLPAWGACGAGTVQITGTPAANQVAQWTDATHIQGLSSVGSGTNPVFATVATPTDGDYLGYNGGIVKNITPGIVPNTQTGTSYTLLTGDRGKVVTQANSSASTYTLPQANTTGFGSNWYTIVQNLGTGAATISPTTSTINAGFNTTSSLILVPGQTASIASDNTNYIAHVSGMPIETGYDAQAAKTTAQTAKTVYTTGPNNTLFHFYGAIDCTTTSAAATVSVSVLFTDISNTAQTITSSTAACTALGSASLNALDYTFMAKAGTTIQYQTTIVNTPTYDVRVAVVQLGIN